jgi:hypothetical protein
MSDKNEQWHFIKNSKIQISSQGRLKYETGRFSRGKGGKKRYHNISIRLINGELLNTSIHKLVAETFLKLSKIIKQSKYPNEKLEIDHKNNKKKDNRLVNLQWVTHKENVENAFETGANSGKKISENTGKKIVYIDKEGNEKVYRNIVEASKNLNINRTSIHRFLKRNEKPRFLRKHKSNGGKKIWINFKYYNENILNEKWKSCYKISPELKHYLVSNHGRVKNTNTKHFIKGSGKRYKRVALSPFPFNKNTSKIRNKAIHRLVAILFIPNPDNKPNVNHMDSKTFNNNVTNLEWCTQQENMIHASKNNLLNSDNSKRIFYKLELDGTIIKELEGCNGDSCISGVASINNIHTLSNGFGYCYKEDYNGSIINPALLKIFPDIDISIIKNRQEWDKLRYYVKDKKKPIWKKELDGTRLEITTDTFIKKHNGSSTSVNSILKKKSKTLFGFNYEYASWKDVINYPHILPYEKKLTKIKNLNIDFSREMDLDLLRNTYKGTLIWKINIDGIRIERYNNIIEARDKNGLGRETIEHVIRGKGDFTINKETGEKCIWEVATYYKNDLNEEYRKIPLNERISNTRIPTRNIIQRDLDGKIIKIWNNRYEIYKELKINISMSYHEQNKYIFNYILYKNEIINILKKQNKIIDDNTKNKDIIQIINYLLDKKLKNYFNNIYDLSHKLNLNIVLYTQEQCNNIINYNEKSSNKIIIFKDLDENYYPIEDKNIYNWRNTYNKIFNLKDLHEIEIEKNKNLKFWLNKEYNNYKNNNLKNDMLCKLFKILLNNDFFKKYFISKEKKQEDKWEKLWLNNFYKMKEEININIESNSKKKITHILKDIDLYNWGCSLMTHFTKTKKIFGNNNKIYDIFKTFINDKKYKPYFLTIEEKHNINLNKIKKFIDKNKRRPTTTKKKTDEEKNLGYILDGMLKSYKRGENIFKNNKIYDLFKLFIEMYYIYFN